MTSNEKKTTSITISQDVWQKFRIYCLGRGVTTSALIEELLKKEMGMI